MYLSSGSWGHRQACRAQLGELFESGMSMIGRKRLRRERRLVVIAVVRRNTNGPSRAVCLAFRLLQIDQARCSMIGNLITAHPDGSRS